MDSILSRPGLLKPNRDILASRRQRSGFRDRVSQTGTVPGRLVSLDIPAAGSEIEKVDYYCYLGSYISSNGSCEKDVKVRIGKAAAVFGKMRKIWRNSNISLKVKTRLYEAINHPSNSPVRC